MTLYVKKLWSLNPTKSKYIPLEQAVKEHAEYCRHFMEAVRRERTPNKEKPKSLTEWLKTEI